MYLFFFFFFFFSSVTIPEKLNQILQELKRIYNFLLTDHRKIKINVGYKIGLLFKSKNEAEVSSEFDSIGNILRDTSFLFFIETSVLHWVLCVLERGKAEGGNGIRGGEATGHRMCRGEGGGRGRWLTREFKTSGIRWWCVTHDSHMRGACDVYGLLRGGRYRVSARAPNTAYPSSPSLPHPCSLPLLEHRK